MQGLSLAKAHLNVPNANMIVQTLAGLLRFDHFLSVPAIAWERIYVITVASTEKHCV